MKKAILLTAVIVASFIGFGQSLPDNVDIGLFHPGTNGSSTSLNGQIEVSLRSVLDTYDPTPVAQAFNLYFIAPKAAGFTVADAMTVTEVNASLYGTGTMLTTQARFDIGDPYIYFPIVLNASSGLDLSALTTLGVWTFAYTFKFVAPKTPGQYNQVRIIDRNNNAALTAANNNTPLFSNLRIGAVNQLTQGAFAVLPVNLINFSGYRNGSKNTLNWTVASEVNNRGFDVQRSADGVNYTSIGFVNSQAQGGFTTSEISYTIDDMNPVGKNNYYQLNQVDIDGRSKLSNVVSISRDRPTLLGIGGLYPNPASTQVNVIIDAPQRDKVMVIVTDMAGKTVIRQQANVDVGSNTVPVDVVKLAGGSYLVKLTCQASDCETAAAKFNKQ